MWLRLVVRRCCGHGVHEFTISHLIQVIKKNDAKRQIIPNASKKRFQYGEHLTYEPLASKMSHFEPDLSGSIGSY